MEGTAIRSLLPQDRLAWEPLWNGYLRFYKSEPTPEWADRVWQRIHDAQEPVHALGAFHGEQLLGIVHYIFHRSTWLAENSCYLQDLFTLEEARGKGVGKLLIEAVSERARQAGSARVYWMTHETNATARSLYDKVARRSGFIQYTIDLG